MDALRVNWFQREPGGTTYAAPAFRTSSYCSSGGCVEVAALSDGGAVIRCTRNPHLTLTFNGTEWSAFLAGVRAGEFSERLTG